ncbi:hypothetical protein VTK26DRAFT_7366 [Humicola hyalothermophila]
MASNSPEPTQPAEDNAANAAPPAPTESEPLLGRPGDATQKPGEPIIHNLWLGTGWLAQVGAIILVAIVWAGVFLHPTLPLVSPHPLLQSLGVFTVIQAILLLQPTTTPETKALGQRGHALLHILSFLLFVAGTAIIQVNKTVNRMPHFHSAHAYLGVATLALLLLQYLFGLAIYVFPATVFGTVERGKSLWKYHRMAGYLLLALLLATVAAAAETDYNHAVLHVRLWGVLVAEVLVLAGVAARVHVGKMGFGSRGGTGRR